MKLKTIMQEIADRDGWAQGECVYLTAEHNSNDYGITAFASHVLPAGAVITQATVSDRTGKPLLEINYQRPAMN